MSQIESAREYTVGHNVAVLPLAATGAFNLVAGIHPVVTARSDA